MTYTDDEVTDGEVFILVGDSVGHLTKGGRGLVVRRHRDEDVDAGSVCAATAIVVLGVDYQAVRQYTVKSLI